jgi:hypothetical protein
LVDSRQHRTICSITCGQIQTGLLKAVLCLVPHDRDWTELYCVSHNKTDCINWLQILKQERNIWKCNICSPK